MRNVIPLVFSTKSVKITATTATTMVMLLYSVLRKVCAPERQEVVSKLDNIYLGPLSNRIFYDFWSIQA